MLNTWRYNGLIAHEKGMKLLFLVKKLGISKWTDKLLFRFILLSHDEPEHSPTEAHNPEELLSCPKHDAYSALNHVNVPSSFHKDNLKY